MCWVSSSTVAAHPHARAMPPNATQPCAFTLTRNPFLNVGIILQRTVQYPSTPRQVSRQGLLHLNASCTGLWPRWWPYLVYST